MAVVSNVESVFLAQQRDIRPHLIRIEVLCQKLSCVSARVGEQHLVNKGNRSGGTFDVEQDPTKRIHGVIARVPVRCVNPKQTGRKPSSTRLSVYCGVQPAVS